MQTRPQTQATFAMPDKPHRLVASDRVEGTQVRRSDGTKVGIVERLMIDKARKGGLRGAYFRRLHGRRREAHPCSMESDEIQRWARRLRDQPERRRVVPRSAF